MNDICSREYPFGRDVDVLVVCMDEGQRRKAIEVLGIRAVYTTIGSALTGRRFKKIVVTTGGVPLSESDEREIKEHLPTRLDVGGSLVIL